MEEIRVNVEQKMVLLVLILRRLRKNLIPSWKFIKYDFHGGIQDRSQKTIASLRKLKNQLTIKSWK